MDLEVKEITSDEFNQMRFLAEYMKVGVAWRAYKNLHPNCSDESARRLGSRMLTKIDISDVLEEVGISDKNLAWLLAQGMTKAVRQHIKEDKGMYGKTYEDVPDYTVRHRYIETALKLKKKLGTKEETDIKDTNVTINVTNYTQNNVLGTNSETNQYQTITAEGGDNYEETQSNEGSYPQGDNSSNHQTSQESITVTSTWTQPAYSCETSHVGSKYEGS